jgi:hypothetical protein
LDGGIQVSNIKVAQNVSRSSGGGNVEGLITRGTLQESALYCHIMIKACTGGIRTAREGHARQSISVAVEDTRAVHNVKVILL